MCAPVPPSSLMRRYGRSVALALGEGLLAALTLTLSVFLAWPHMWFLVRNHVLVRVSDPYRPGDTGGTLFLMARALSGETGESSRLLAWPEGFAFVSDFNNRVLTDLMAWGWRLFGMPLGYNAWAVFFLVTNGLAVHLAARLAGTRRAPAVLAVALLLAATSSWSRAWMLVPGVACLGLALAIYPYGPVLLVPWAFLAVFGAVRGGDGTERLRSRAGRVALVTLAASLTLVPWLLDPRVHAHGSFGLPVDPCQISLAMKDLFQQRQVGGELRWVPLVLWLGVGVGATLNPRGALSWGPPLVAALFLLSMGLGASPWTGAEHERCGDSPSWMPFVALMKAIPWIRGCPRPTRWALPGALLLSLSAGLALSARWRSRPRLGRGLGDGLALALCAAVVASVRFSDLRQKYLPWPPLPILPELAQDAVLLDLPTRYADDKVPLLLHAMDRIPRIEPPGNRYRDWLRSLDPDEWPLVLALDGLQDREEVRGDLLERLSRGIPEVEAGLRHVVLHPKAASPEGMARQEALLLSLGAKEVSAPPPIRVFALEAR